VEPEPANAVPEPVESLRWLTRGVGSIGLASFFSDSGHEIATSVLPTFVTAAATGAIGLAPPPGSRAASVTGSDPGLTPRRKVVTHP